MYLKDGDRNTLFFHCRATIRKRRNTISGIKDRSNQWCTQANQIVSVFGEYYKELFTSANPESVPTTISSIPQFVTDDMNASLTKNFQAWEVELALKQTVPLTAPGLDGPLFFQNYWDLVKGDVTNTILTFLNLGSLPSPFNHIFLTLIPKVKNSERVTEFRPISLCNVLYKIFSKVLANRLKRILPLIISEHQSAFLKGRLITVNILVAFETLHYMKNHNSGNTGFMALKLDMSKAYDRVEWSFLKDVMIKMGFNDKWIALVMECITFVSYSLLVNGEPYKHIILTKDIRQRDPLSPYLFLLCSEDPHRLIQATTNNGEIKGVSICRNGPKLTHLLFADDSLFFVGLPSLNVKRSLKYSQLMRGYRVRS